MVERMPTKNCFYSLFSGKIDHSILVSKKIAEDIQKNIK